jgi:lipopolysaccharide export LptBFGC system permease protein LptF
MVVIEVIAFALWYGPPLVVAVWRMPFLYLALAGYILQRYLPAEEEK